MSSFDMASMVAIVQDGADFNTALGQCSDELQHLVKRKPALMKNFENKLPRKSSS